MVRDVFHVCGFVELGARGTIQRIVLNGAAAWARRCANPLRALLKQQHRLSTEIAGFERDLFDQVFKIHLTHLRFRKV